jgi:hypothetical protein
MMDSNYHDILRQARELTLEQQLQLIGELSQPTKEGNGKHHITELRGLGKSRWQGIHADDYLRAERDSWTG